MTAVFYRTGVPDGELRRTLKHNDLKRRGGKCSNI